MADQLAGRWDEQEESRCLEYEYRFLHPGLMRALLCDIGSRSKEGGVYWKFGVWVYEKSTGCRALLEQQMSDENRGRITLKIQGRRNEHLARWLRERIEARSRLFGYPDLTPTVDDFGVGVRTVEREATQAALVSGRRAADPGHRKAADRAEGGGAEEVAGRAVPEPLA